MGTFAPGDRVRLPEGIIAEVLAVDDETVVVRLDGESTGRYPADRLAPAPAEEER